MATSNGISANTGGDQSENHSAQRIIESVNSKSNTNKLVLNPINSKRNSGFNNKMSNGYGTINPMKSPVTNDQIVVIDDN